MDGERQQPRETLEGERKPETKKWPTLARKRSFVQAEGKKETVKAEG